MLNFETKEPKPGTYRAQIIRTFTKADLEEALEIQGKLADNKSPIPTFKVVWKILDGKYKDSVVNQAFKFDFPFSDGQIANSKSKMEELLKNIFGKATGFKDYEELGAALLDKKAMISLIPYNVGGKKGVYVDSTESMEDIIIDDEIKF